jgi:hypothetical protein
MKQEEDFSVEDNEETVTTMAGLANSEYSQLIARLKYDARRTYLLKLRSMGRIERKTLKGKHNVGKGP